MSDELVELWAAFKEAAIAECGRYGAAELLDLAANVLRAGVTLGVAAQVLGHDPAVLARRYGHLETEVLRKAQEQAWKHAA